MIEISSHRCRPTEKLELKRRAEALQREFDGRIFYRRVWVLFSLAVLGRGIWDSCFSQFHPLWGPIVIVGGAISAMTLGLMILKDRRDRKQGESAELLLRDAESGEYQQVRITGINQVLPVEELDDRGLGFVMKTRNETVYLGGPFLQDALEEFQYSLRESMERIDVWFSSAVLLEVWPHSQQVRSVELTGEPVLIQKKGIEFSSLPVQPPACWKVLPVKLVLFEEPAADRDSGSFIPQE